MMSLFYEKLTSRANRNEFPDNQNHRFKNRLHHPLILREPGWRVGVSSLSIPVARPVSQTIGDVGKDLIEWSFWDENEQGSMSRSYVDITPDQLFKDGYVKSGVDMMTFFTHTPRTRQRAFLFRVRAAIGSLGEG